MDDNGLTLSQLKKQHGEYRQIAAEFADKASKLEPHIACLEEKARKKQKEALLKDISAGGAAAFENRDVVFLINRSAAMGEGFAGFAGSAVLAAMELHDAAQLCDNAKISASFWGSGSSVAVKFGDFGAIDALVSKTAPATATDILPVAKEILTANTPDRADGRPRHYIIVAPVEMATDRVAAKKIMEAVLAFNPAATIDVVLCGKMDVKAFAVASSVTPVLGDDCPLAGVEKPENLAARIKTLLGARLGGKADKAMQVKMPQL